DSPLAHPVADRAQVIGIRDLNLARDQYCTVPLYSRLDQLVHDIAEPDLACALQLTPQLAILLNQLLDPAWQCIARRLHRRGRTIEQILLLQRAPVRCGSGNGLDPTDPCRNTALAHDPALPDVARVSDVRAAAQH